MRFASVSALCLVLIGLGCKEERKTTSNQPATPTTPAPSEPTGQTFTPGPTTDKKDILGTWQTKEGDPVQVEFTADTVVMRTGPGPDWKETGRYKYRMNDQTKLREIDWGEGPTAAYGVYTIDGKNLIITYGTGSPANRPKSLAKKPPATQLFMTKVQ